MAPDVALELQQIASLPLQQRRLLTASSSGKHSKSHAGDVEVDVVGEEGGGSADSIAPLADAMTVSCSQHCLCLFLLFFLCPFISTHCSHAFVRTIHCLDNEQEHCLPRDEPLFYLMLFPHHPCRPCPTGCRATHSCSRRCQQQGGRRESSGRSRTTPNT